MEIAFGAYDCAYVSFKNRKFSSMGQKDLFSDDDLDYILNALFLGAKWLFWVNTDQSFSGVVSNLAATLRSSLCERLTFWVFTRGTSQIKWSKQQPPLAKKMPKLVARQR